MIRNQDIVVVGLQPWDIKIGSNCKNIALQLARYNRVLYVNPPLDRITVLRGRKDPAVAKRLEIRRTEQNLLSISGNLWNLYPRHIIHSINRLPGATLFDAANRVNNRLLAGDIREALAKLSFRDFILFNDSDMFRSFYLKELLNPRGSVYYSRDNLMAVPYFYTHGRRLEPKLMEKSSLVCANSTYLTGVASAYNPRSFYVGQGCDLSLFDPARVGGMPGDLASLPRPIIGYIGAIVSYRLDLPLLEELCSRQREWSFVFVGKEDEAFRRSGLHGLNNVFFPGLKKEEQLPAYLAQFDVAINPQRINPMTIGNYPRKIDEYLAMGKPVVATATETMGIFSDFVHLGETAEDYIGLIGKALRENDSALADRRMRFAATHTWENSVEAISAAIEEILPH
jgi:glycosyltransferase involved in cell wall biosynthesis